MFPVGGAVHEFVNQAVVSRGGCIIQEGIKLKIDIIIADNLLEQAIEAIQKSAHTGRIGDGKIYVTNVEQAVRIRTGETGDAAV